MGKTKNEKLPITFGPASNALGAKVKITAGDKSQVVSQSEFRAFRAIAEALEIPMKPAK